MKMITLITFALALLAPSISIATEPAARESSQAATGTAVAQLIATLTAAPGPFAVAAIATAECGGESARCVAIARRIFRASRVIARAVVKSGGGGGFAAFVRRQPNVVAAVFRSIAVARAEWALRRPARGQKRLSSKVLRDAEKVLAAALISGRLPRRLAPELERLRSYVQRKPAEPSPVSDTMILGTGSVPISETAARTQDTAGTTPRATAEKGKRDREALPNFVWRRIELDARDTDKVPLKRIIAELKGIADVVNKGVPLGGGVSIRPDKVEGHWGIRIMGVFAEEDDDDASAPAKP